MLMEKPVIATRYGGNLEFMNDANSFLCGYESQLIGDAAPECPSQTRWAEPDTAEAARLMRTICENPAGARQRGVQARLDLCSRHHPAAGGAFIRNRLRVVRQKAPAALPLTTRHPEGPPADPAVRKTNSHEG
jgi:hypothetical protein